MSEPRPRSTSFLNDIAKETKRIQNLGTQPAVDSSTLDKLNQRAAGSVADTTDVIQVGSAKAPQPATKPQMTKELLDEMLESAVIKPALQKGISTRDQVQKQIDQTHNAGARHKHIHFKK